MNDLEFITRLVNDGATIKNIHTFDLPLLDKIRFIKLDGHRYLDKLERGKQIKPRQFKIK